jgi:hypothetical protein
MNDLSVATTIAEQLGGTSRLKAMIGATNFLGDDKSLSFRFSATAKNLANHVAITLDPSDTYTVEFARIGRAPEFKVNKCGTASMIYADNLRLHIETATGLRLSL